MYADVVLLCFCVVVAGSRLAQKMAQRININAIMAQNEAQEGATREGNDGSRSTFRKSRLTSCFFITYVFMLTFDDLGSYPRRKNELSINQAECLETVITLERLYLSVEMRPSSSTRTLF